MAIWKVFRNFHGCTLLLLFFIIFFIIKAELGLQETEKTLKLYLAYVTASLAPRVCLAYGYLLFSSVLSKYMGMPVVEVTHTLRRLKEIAVAPIFGEANTEIP